MRRWLKGGPSPPAPPRLDVTAELLDEFERENVLRVPSPDGAGTYTFVNNKTNIKGYPVTLYWDGETHGSTVHYRYPGHPAHKKYGGEVAYWFASHWRKDVLAAKEEDAKLAKVAAQRAIAALILQFIQSGKQIYRNNCGAVMSVDEGY